jgi:hypothetical protein
LQHGWLQQLWLDHLLLLLATRDVDGLDAGLFVVAYSAVNAACHAAGGIQRNAHAGGR